MLHKHKNETKKNAAESKMRSNYRETKVIEGLQILERNQIRVSHARMNVVYSN